MISQNLQFRRIGKSDRTKGINHAKLLNFPIPLWFLVFFYFAAKWEPNEAIPDLRFVCGNAVL